MAAVVLSVRRMQWQFHMYFSADPGGTMILYGKRTQHTQTNMVAKVACADLNKQ